MVATFGLLISFQFVSNPCFVRIYPCFNADIFLPSSTVTSTYVVDSPYIVSRTYPMISHAQCANKAEEGGVIQAENFVCGCVRKIILERNVLCQAKALSRVPVWFPVPQGTGETGSTDPAGVQPHNHDCNIAIDPTM